MTNPIKIQGKRTLDQKINLRGNREQHAAACHMLGFNFGFKSRLRKGVLNLKDWSTLNVPYPE